MVLRTKCCFCNFSFTECSKGKFRLPNMQTAQSSPGYFVALTMPSASPLPCSQNSQPSSQHHQDQRDCHSAVAPAEEHGIHQKQAQKIGGSGDRRGLRHHMPRFPSRHGSPRKNSAEYRSHGSVAHFFHGHYATVDQFCQNHGTYHRP